MAQREALRWLDGLAYHTWRALHHLADGNKNESEVPKGMPDTEPPA